MPIAKASVSSFFTTPGGTVVIGSGNKLTDSATLSGGYNPTGTITFKLYAPDGTTVVDTETATVNNGNGTYSTPNGYLPTATGTYQWVASYGGDSNNNLVSSNNGDEPETVSPAQPTLTTQASGDVALGTIATTISDTADLEGAYNPTGSITFTLTLDGNSVAGSTQTDQVSGNGPYTRTATRCPPRARWRGPTCGTPCTPVAMAII